MWFLKSKENEKKKAAIKKEKEEYEFLVSAIKEKIASMEYMEFKYRKWESVRKFYETAKLYCYANLEDVQKREREKKEKK